MAQSRSAQAPGYSRPSRAPTAVLAVVLGLVCVIVAPGIRAAAVEASATPSLQGLMAERLALMPAVAAAKFRSGQPVLDPAREAAVLAEARAAALRVGLVPETVEALFVAQMAAARAIQTRLVKAWSVPGAAVPEASDLATTIRPALSRLTPAIVAAAADVARGLAPATLEGMLTSSEGGMLDDSARAALTQAVAGLRAYPSRLAQITATGVLRVGMTGDYAPFSLHAAASGSNAMNRIEDWSGIDVDLAQELAASLDVELEIVPTTWATLTEDLSAGAFDLAVGGVSRTLDRQRVGLQTAPYHADGKTPIIRCADRDRFSSLADIDQPGVRVIVNPGGTNQRFVGERVTRAAVQVHPDNRTIFDELVAGRADVMFTDRIEVELQTRAQPALCAALADDLTYQEKSWLLPQDPIWLAYVDTWLALRLADGHVDRAFMRHGATRRPARGH